MASGGTSSHASDSLYSTSIRGVGLVASMRSTVTCVPRVLRLFDGQENPDRISASPRSRAPRSRKV